MHWASFSRQYPNAPRAFRAFRSIGTGPALAKKNPANVWALISSDARTNALIQSERSARVSDALPARLSPGPRKISGVRSVPAIPRRSLRTPLPRPAGMANTHSGRWRNLAVVHAGEWTRVCGDLVTASSLKRPSIARSVSPGWTSEPGFIPQPPTPSDPGSHWSRPVDLLLSGS